ncbi:MAG: hypothetical protein E7458_06840 [Ruminococcaceae bacterium]|nr:hypothetical protein [Oscillospiraceae bacterium]
MMQDEKRNIPEQDDLDEIKMLLGDDSETLEDADALLNDILKEYQIDAPAFTGDLPDPETILAEIENLSARLDGTAPLAEEDASMEIVEAEHTAEDEAAFPEDAVPAADAPHVVSDAQRRNAARRTDNLQTEIAHQVEAAMDERQRENTGKSQKSGKRDTETYDAAPAQPTYESAAEEAVELGRISDDLRAFRNIAPDEAAAKAKRAVGYYSWRCTITGILAVIAWYITAAPAYQWWLPSFISYVELPYIYLLILCVLQVAAMLMSVSLISDGLRHAIKLNFKSETLIALSSIVSLIYTLSIMAVPASAGYLPFTPVVILGLFIGLFARRQRYKSIRWSCRAAARPDGKYCSVKGMRDTEGRVRTVYKTAPHAIGEKFMTALLEEDSGERMMRLYTPLVIIVSLLFALIAALGKGVPGCFLYYWSAILAVSVPCGVIFCQVIPLAAVSAKLSRIGVALAGSRGIHDISSTEAAIVGETDVFPTKMVTVNGVQAFSGFTGEKVNLCALSVLKASGSSLYDAFAASLPGQPMSLPAVEGFEFFETGGMGAYVNGEKVLLGTANFILRMGIRVAEGINLKNGVFIAINMQFAGVFSIKYDAQPSVRRSLTYMVKHKIVPVLAVRDFNINPQLVETRFKLNPDNFGYPDLEERIAYSAIRHTDMEEDCAVLAVDNLHSFGEAISSGKRVQSSVNLNRVLGLISACLGIPLTFYLLFMQSYSAVTPYNMFYYLLLWLCPVLLSSFGATRR